MGELIFNVLEGGNKLIWRKLIPSYGNTEGEGEGIMLSGPA